MLSSVAPDLLRQFLNWSINEDGAFPELRTSHIFQNTSPFPFLQDSHHFLSLHQTCLVHFKVVPLLVFLNAVVENLPCWVYDYQTRDCYYRGNANSCLLFGIYQCLLNPPWHAVVHCSWFYFSSSLLLPDFSTLFETYQISLGSEKAQSVYGWCEFFLQHS